MAGFSPPAIRRLFDRLRGDPGGYPNAQLAGIFANTAGYHNARNNFPPRGNYSVLLPDDLAGNGWAGAGLDITMRHPPDMARMTQRLIDLTMAREPRIQCLREFFGTVNGHTVTGLDVRDRRWVSSDATHLWHVHISVFRRHAEDMALMNGVADAMLGATSGGGGGTVIPPEPVTSKDEDMRLIRSRSNGQIFAVGVGYWRHVTTPAILDAWRNSGLVGDPVKIYDLSDGEMGEIRVAIQGASNYHPPR